MWKKNDDLSGLLSSPEAQALAGMLKGMDSDMLNKAASLASSGDTSGAQSVLAPLLQDPKIRELMKKLEEQNGGI